MSGQTLLGLIQQLQRHGSFSGCHFICIFCFCEHVQFSMHPPKLFILEIFLFQLPNFYVQRSISSFIEQHGTNTTAGDEVLKKLWSTEGVHDCASKAQLATLGKKSLL